VAKRVRPNLVEIESAMKNFIQNADKKYPHSGYAFACGYFESAMTRFLMENVPAEKAREFVNSLIEMSEQGSY